MNQQEANQCQNTMGAFSSVRKSKTFQGLKFSRPRNDLVVAAAGGHREARGGERGGRPAGENAERHESSV